MNKAFKQLYLAHGRALQAYLKRKLHDPTLAADLAHEAFLRVVQAGKEANIGNDRAYLFRTAHNLAIDHIRSIKRQRTDQIGDDKFSTIAEDITSLEDAVAARHLLDRLQSIVEELPDRTRRIFILVKIEEHSYAQSADRLGISESSVQKHLAIALAHVVQRMKPQ